jgi:hypothetical protein
VEPLAATLRPVTEGTALFTENTSLAVVRNDFLTRFKAFFSVFFIGGN